jgi:hypothetical protein
MILVNKKNLNYPYKISQHSDSHHKLIYALLVIENIQIKIGKLKLE